MSAPTAAHHAAMPHPEDIALYNALVPLLDTDAKGFCEGTAAGPALSHGWRGNALASEGLLFFVRGAPLSHGQRPLL